MKKVLIVEDEADIRGFEVIGLKRAGYTTTEATSGEEALEVFEENGGDFDIALLDISMPGMDGFTLCRALRERSPELGIIMLTARSQETDKISGLMMGADDYITKPFSPTELTARVDSLYRRVQLQKNRVTVPTRSDTVILGDFALDTHRRVLKKSGKEIELTQVEYQIMEYFFTNPDSALSRTAILKRVWGTTYVGEEKIVDVNIRRLRMKVEDDPSDPKHLLTVWGMGYRWCTN